MKIIAFAGPKGSGKSFVAQMAEDILRNNGFRPVKLLFAEPLKDGCSLISGIPKKYFYDPNLKEVKPEGFDYTARDLMVDVGQYLKSKFGQDFFVKSIRNRIEDLYNLSRSMGTEDEVVFLIDDLRFVSEADMILDMGGSIIFVNPLETYDESIEISERGIYPIYKGRDNVGRLTNDRSRPDNNSNIRDQLSNFLAHITGDNNNE